MQNPPLYYKQDGDGKDIVLLGGIAGSTRYYDSHTALLVASGFRVTRIDLAGFGKSKNYLAVDYTMDTHAELLHNTLAHAGTTNPTLIGYSGSCSLVLHYAAKYSNKIKNAIGFCPTLYKTREAASEFAFNIGNVPRWVLQGRSAERLCNIVCSKPILAVPIYQMIGRLYPGKVRRDARLHTWKSYSETVEAFVHDYRPEHDAAKLSAPYTIVYGDKDASMDEPYTKKLEKEHSHINALRIEGVSHQLPYEDINLWVETVIDLAKKS